MPNFAKLRQNLRNFAKQCNFMEILHNSRNYSCLSNYVWKICISNQLNNKYCIPRARPLSRPLSPPLFLRIHQYSTAPKFSITIFHNSYLSACGECNFLSRFQAGFDQKGENYNLNHAVQLFHFILLLV